jgi:hypothetical protein
MKKYWNQSIFKKNLTTYVLISFLTSISLTCLYSYLMKVFIWLEPIFDEIWKLDVITSPSILKKIASLPYALAPGWAFIIKGISLLMPLNFHTFRIFTFIWILPSIFLVPLIFFRLNKISTMPTFLFSGLLCLVYANSIQNLISYANPYTFEIFYSIVLIFLFSRWDDFEVKGNIFTLIVLALTPFFSFSPMFYLPYFYFLIFLKSTNFKQKIYIAISALFALCITLYLYKFIYVSAKSAFMLWFWDKYLTHGSLLQLLHLLSDFPQDILGSILPQKILNTLGFPLSSSLIVILFGIIFLGLRVLYSLNKTVVIYIIFTSFTACVISYFITWPLDFYKGFRINAAILWPYYFAFGVGVSFILESWLPKSMFGKIFNYIIILAFILPTLKPYPSNNLPDTKDRNVYSDIEANIYPLNQSQALVFSMHYSTDPHANYLLQNKWPNQFSVINIGHQEMDETYLQKIKEVISSNATIDCFYIIVPHFLFHLKVMSQVKNFSVPNFTTDKVINGQGSLIIKFIKR